jgi:hypothetical protein
MRPVVAVVERMNALELVMDERHLDQWIGGTERIVIEAFEVGHQRHDGGRILRRRIDRVAGTVPQRGARELAEAGIVLLQLGLDTDDVIAGQEAGTSHRLEPDPQRVAVTRHLLGRGAMDGVRKSGGAEQLVGRGDDVFDGRAVLGFLQAQGADQDPLVGH